MFANECKVESALADITHLLLGSDRNEYNTRLQEWFSVLQEPRVNVDSAEQLKHILHAILCRSVVQLSTHQDEARHFLESQGEVYASVDEMDRRPENAIIQHCRAQNLKVFHGNVYRRHFLTTLDGKTVFTHAYVKLQSLQQFVNKIAFTGSVLGNALVRRPTLVRHCEKLLPQLEVTRGLFSFRNGVYDLKANKFYRHEDQDITANTQTFHDSTFGSLDVEDPLSIATPSIDSIFQAQGWDIETITWFCVMVGRLLLKHNALNDNWNVWPFLYGPGSGKHVLLHLITQMIGGRDHVFEQGAHTAGSFGKSVGMSQRLDKKHCFILSRVDGDCNMRQSTLAKMICGDVIDISLKLQGMTPIQWNVQGICSGHEFFQDDNLTLIQLSGLTTT